MPTRCNQAYTHVREEEADVMRVSERIICTSSRRRFLQSVGILAGIAATLPSWGSKVAASRVRCGAIQTPWARSGSGREAEEEDDRDG